MVSFLSMVKYSTLKRRKFLFSTEVFSSALIYLRYLLPLTINYLDAKEHLKDLEKAAEINMIDVPWKDEELIFEMEHLLSQVPQKKKYIRLLISSGEGLGLLSSKQRNPIRSSTACQLKLKTKRHTQRASN